jgi:hypothetical protein
MSKDKKFAKSAIQILENQKRLQLVFVNPTFETIKLEIKRIKTEFEYVPSKHAINIISREIYKILKKS